MQFAIFPRKYFLALVLFWNAEVQIGVSIKYIGGGNDPLRGGNLDVGLINFDFLGVNVSEL